jgi:hypothetical protein
MPGDELLPNPTYLASRAITIDATPQEIWPWLIQMGFKRAGFYGYDMIENLGSPRGIQSALRIVPEFQHPEVGDELPISLAGGLRFYAIEPNRYLIWSGDLANGGYIYTWALYPIDEHRTRLVSRARLNHIWSKPDQLAFGLITEFAEHLGIPKILQGVKGRVEGHNESMAQANIEVAIYLTSAFTYLVAVVLTFLRPLTWRRGLACFAAGVAWLITWYGPVSIWIGALLELLVLGWLRRVFRQDTTPKKCPICSTSFIKEPTLIPFTPRIPMRPLSTSKRTLAGAFRAWIVTSSSSIALSA